MREGTARRGDPYKTLISGTLRQHTALSIGGNEPHGRVDSPVARDGRGELVLRGSGLAGALIATARTLYPGLSSELPWVSEGLPGGTPGPRRQVRGKPARLFESVWRFYHAHPEHPPAWTEVRSGVGIRQDTGAAAEGIHFETEVLPAGLRWSFLMEVDEFRDPTGGLTLSLALRALREWEGGRCFLGRNVARGLGWASLEQVQIRRLRPDDADLWPNAYMTPAGALKDIPRNRIMAPDERARWEGLLPTRERHVLSGSGLVSFGFDALDADGIDETWGLDTLSLGGSEAMRAAQDEAIRAFVDDLPGENTTPDGILAWAACIGPDQRRQGWRPFIPGSGLRGPLRHALSWWLRSRCRHTVLDPNTAAARRLDLGPPDPVCRLFGRTDTSAALLISDAELEGAGADQPGRDDLLWLKQHAEDEFTQGTCGALKFNRLGLARGRFRFRYFVEARSAEELREFRDYLDLLRTLGAWNQLPLGGGKWRGHGWGRWQWVDDAEERAVQ